MKVAVSIPQPVFSAAEREAAKQAVSRSELYARALRAYLEQRDDASVTERLNRVYGEEADAVDRELAAMQLVTLERNTSGARRASGKKRRW